MATTRLFTIQDVIDLPDDGCRFELIRGELHRMSPASGKHGAIAFEIAGAIRDYLRKHPIGRGFTADTGFILARDPDVLLAPDVAFVRSERLPPEGEQSGFLAVAPDIAVEILSPWDRPARVTEKVLEYLRAGVAEVWLIDPEERTLAVHRPDLTVQTISGDATFEVSSVLPGLRIPLADLFSY